LKIKNLTSRTRYCYHIRAVDEKSGIKSPFAPKVFTITLLEDDEFYNYFSNIWYGWTCNTKNRDKKYFNNKPISIGIDKTIGIFYGVVSFNLKNIPKNAIIKEAVISLYQLNRVNRDRRIWTVVDICAG
jgi:hypothetical protein